MEASHVCLIDQYPAAAKGHAQEKLSGRMTWKDKHPAAQRALFASAVKYVLQCNDGWSEDENRDSRNEVACYADEVGTMAQRCQIAARLQRSAHRTNMQTKRGREPIVTSGHA